MNLRETAARLSRSLVRLVKSAVRGRTRRDRAAAPSLPPPVAQTIPDRPPPLPPARVKYVLYRCGDGVFDVYDGDQMVGDLFRQDGGGERDTYWVATLYHAHFDWFRTLKAAKGWLGHPPVRKYRHSKTDHLDIGGRPRERRDAPQR